MGFAMNFSEKISHQENQFSYVLKTLLFQAWQNPSPTWF